MRARPQHLLAMASALILAAGVAAVGPYSGTASAAQVMHLYTALPISTAVTNPERGYYRHTETHYGLAAKPYAPLDLVQMTGWRQNEGVTLALRLFYLDKFAGQDTLDADFLTKVKADLQTAHAAKIKLIVRFAYSASSSVDAPPARAEKHIAQLARVINGASGTVFALQAGFVGRWGEWYYSTNYLTDQAHPWILSQADWDARARVLNALLTKISTRIPVQVRTVPIKQKLVPDTDPRAGRIGIANDCFLGKYQDQGTYAGAADRDWLAHDARRVLVGGETCEVNTDGNVPGGTTNHSLWPNASAELVRYRWTFLNDRYKPEVLASWGSTAVTQNKARLGYRLRLVKATLPTTGTAGGSLAVSLTFANDGYAPLVRPRKGYLVLRNQSGNFAQSLPINFTTIARGTTKTFNVVTTTTAPAGTYGLHLALPDPVAALSTDPAYAIRLANSNMQWSGSGYHSLSAQIQVAPAS